LQELVKALVELSREETQDNPARANPTRQWRNDSNIEGIRPVPTTEHTTGTTTPREAAREAVTTARITTKGIRTNIGSKDISEGPPPLQLCWMETYNCSCQCRVVNDWCTLGG